MSARTQAMTLAGTDEGRGRYQDRGAPTRDVSRNMLRPIVLDRHQMMDGDDPVVMARTDGVWYGDIALGHTFGGNTLSSAAGVAAVRELLDRDLCVNARRIGDHLRASPRWARSRS